MLRNPAVEFLKNWVLGAGCVAGLIGQGNPAVAAGSGALPSGLIGEAAIVALAFALPALAAGAYLLAQRIWSIVGSRLGFGLLAVGAAGGLMSAIVGWDFAGAGRLLKLAGI